MKYKGYSIEADYLVGSTFREVGSTGRMVDRKPTNKDIEGYSIYEPGKSTRIAAASSIKEAKQFIRDLET